MKRIPFTSSATTSRGSRWPTFLAAAALAYLVGAVFFPIVGFEFADYDVPEQLLANPYGQGLSGQNLRYILTSRCVTSYYPIRSLTFAVDYELWGLHPGGFKLTNGLIHLANVLLVFWLSLRLFRYPDSASGSPAAWRDLCAATFSAGIFAVHPVVVEPVVWVAGREELLMTLGALGCMHFHLTARRLSEEGGKPRRALACHVSAALCCAVACLSNAVAAVIPLLIVAWDVLTLPRPKLLRILGGTSALGVIGAATIVIKRLGPDNISALAAEFGVFSAQRLALVLEVYWLNLKTLLWPVGLAVEYPDITPKGFADAGVVLGGISVGLTCVILWSLRARRLILYGLLWYVLALGPTAQIMPHHVHRADRFLYLPLVGLALAAAMGLRPLVSLLKGRVMVAGAIAAGILGLFLLVAISANQVQTWRTSLSMWQNCLRVDPNNAKAHGGLADNLAKAGQFEQALQHYRQSLLLDPNDLPTLHNSALLLATCREQRFRNYDAAIALAERACQVAEPSDPGPVMILAEVYAQAGRAEMAVPATEKAIRLAEAAGKSKLADDLRQKLKLYQDDVADSSPP